jgi:hypothetical protein
MLVTSILPHLALRASLTIVHLKIHMSIAASKVNAAAAVRTSSGPHSRGLRAIRCGLQKRFCGFVNLAA